MRKSRLAVAAGAALAATLTMTPTAQANTVTFRDARGDAPRHIDLIRARVDNGDTKPRQVLIRIRVAGTLQSGDNVTVWFNRNSDPGPELRLSGWVDSEFVLRRVHTWNGPGNRASCDLYSMKQRAENRVMKVRIKRACLGRGPVKVAIRSKTQSDRLDWFQGRRSFLPGVRR